MGKSARLMKAMGGRDRQAVAITVFMAMQQQAFRVRLKLAWKILTKADIRKVRGPVL